MRYSLSLLFMMALATCFSNCAKNSINALEKDNNSPATITDSTLKGNWELRTLLGGWGAVHQYASGNGNSIRFMAGSYETLTPDGTRKTGKYQLISRGADRYTELRFDTLDNFLRPPVYGLSSLHAVMPVYITLSNNRLRFILGDGLAVDGTETLYERKMN